MAFNPEYLARWLVRGEEHTATLDKGKGKAREIVEQHSYTLVASLPPSSFLDREARQQALISEEQAKMQETVAEALDDELDIDEDSLQKGAETPLPSPPASTSSRSRLGAAIRSRASSIASSKTAGSGAVRKRNWESHDVYRAIEKKDLSTLFEIRDSAFHLLVQKTGPQTPLLYASRIGKSHKEIAILLTGALSRFVNHLPDDVSQITPELQSQIRAVRANLKLAINESISTNQTELISSYLQIIIMSEGEKWIKDQTQNVSLALRAGKSARPVNTARKAVTNFATRELRQLEKGNAVASVEDYLSNATSDLILMALWSLITDRLGGGLLPSYQFGRDERIYKTFCDSLDRASKQSDYIAKVPKTIRQQVATAVQVMEGRSASHSEKCRLLAEVLDSPC